MPRQRLNDLIKKTVRKLRKDQTDYESILWAEIRNRKLMGMKFLRQHPLIFEYNGKKRFLIADFYCHEAKLVIEVDGGIHEQQKDYDAVRDLAINDLGINVIRFNNKDISQDLTGTIRKITNYLKIDN